MCGGFFFNTNSFRVNTMLVRGDATWTKPSSSPCWRSLKGEGFQGYETEGTLKSFFIIIIYIYISLSSNGRGLFIASPLGPFAWWLRLLVRWNQVFKNLGFVDGFGWLVFVCTWVYACRNLTIYCGEILGPGALDSQAVPCGEVSHGGTSGQ